jgi:hypothetical protein
VPLSTEVLRVTCTSCVRQENATSTRTLLATMRGTAGSDATASGEVPTLPSGTGNASASANPIGVLVDRVDATHHVVDDEAAMAAALVATPFSLGYANALTIATWGLTHAHMVNAGGWTTALGQQSVQAAVQDWSTATRTEAQAGLDPLTGSVSDSNSIRVEITPPPQSGVVPVPSVGDTSTVDTNAGIASSGTGAVALNSSSRLAWPAVFVRYAG